MLTVFLFAEGFVSVTESLTTVHPLIFCFPLHTTSEYLITVW